MTGRGILRQGDPGWLVASCRVCGKDIAAGSLIHARGDFDTFGWLADRVRAHLRDEHGEGA